MNPHKSISFHIYQRSTIFASIIISIPQNNFFLGYSKLFQMVSHDPQMCEKKVYVMGSFLRQCAEHEWGAKSGCSGEAGRLHSAAEEPWDRLCACFRPKEWNCYCNIRDTWQRVGENVLEGRGLFILWSPPGGITVQTLGVARAERVVNVREDTSLAASSSGEHSQARLQVTACTVPTEEGLWASGLSQEDQQLSVLFTPHYPLRVKTSWRQRRCQPCSLIC